MEFFEHADPLLKTFWFIAIPASIIFLIQGVMTLIGLDSSDGVSADFDGDLVETEAPFQLFTVRNLINFLLGFGWAGISLYSVIPGKALLIAAAVSVGALFVIMFFLIIRQIRKLGENNSFRIENCLHKTAEVYIPIPAAKSGAGKIIISVKGSVRELDAMTEGSRIESSARVRVVRIDHGQLLIVEKI